MEERVENNLEKGYNRGAKVKAIILRTTNDIKTIQIILKIFLGLILTIIL